MKLTSEQKEELTERAKIKVNPQHPDHKQVVAGEIVVLFNNADAALEPQVNPQPVNLGGKQAHTNSGSAQKRGSIQYSGSPMDHRE